MSRKGIGIGAFDRHRLTSAQYASHGTTLRTTNAAALETQLAVFRSLLQQFAQTHARGHPLRPILPRAVRANCAPPSGSNPLGSSGAIVVAVGRQGPAPRSRLWGPMRDPPPSNKLLSAHRRCSLSAPLEVREGIAKGRPEGAPEVTDDDVLRAVGTLKPLGGAFAVLRVGSKSYIRSVPKELNTDQSAVLEAVQVLGYVSVGMLMANLGWPRARAVTAVEDLLGEGMLWVDKQSPVEWEYWSPGFMLDEGSHGD
ncbi:vacuolar-sorting protein SNF8 [Verticillium dahliae VdLs.17]|uniref:Vacuolar-sorting protein SNF8 n=1 Tax=Verticillium dahliae (strain VdLs.17 / ATCC MYA-4575 / FGSC 10137) TaxID=498257 RepID=G2X696_VERDV|nr:vacuolar-sorting protein SNF8 [Verticillium dahliae VdLs.17]EGY14514.1 vacuolar-sorting protein SNF8 [Verticillium dahliae VdLs.17]